jgi:hypothetical protein
MSGFSDEFDELDNHFARTLADITARLDAKTDFDAVLADIYARAAGIETTPPPGQVALRTAEDDVAGPVKAVTDRIAMLIAVLDSPVARDLGSPTIVATVYMPAARRSLRQLRDGLLARQLSQKAALRLLGNVGHNLGEADAMLRQEEGNSLDEALRGRVAEPRELGGDLTAHTDALRGQIVRLFEHADEFSGATPVSTS